MDETLTVKQVAEILKITGNGVVMLIRRGTLPAKKHGRDWLIRKSDLDEHIQKRQKPGRPPTHRACVRCHIEKPMEDYPKNVKAQWGYHPWCKECFSTYKKEKRKTAYGEKERAYCHGYYERHKEYFREKHARLYREKKDHLSKQYRAWCQTPTGRAAQRRGAHVRRVRLMNTVNDVTTEQIAELMQRQKKCAYCKKRFTKQRYATLDHVIPLSKGGPHTISNLVLACKFCNSSKHNDVLHLI